MQQHYYIELGSTRAITVMMQRSDLSHKFIKVIHYEFIMVAHTYSKIIKKKKYYYYLPYNIANTTHKSCDQGGGVRGSRGLRRTH